MTHPTDISEQRFAIMTSSLAQNQVVEVEDVEDVESHVDHHSSNSHGKSPTHHGIQGAKYVNSPLSMNGNSESHATGSTASGKSTNSISLNADSSTKSTTRLASVTPRVMISYSEDFFPSTGKFFQRNGGYNLGCFIILISPMI